MGVLLVMFESFCCIIGCKEMEEKQIPPDQYEINQNHFQNQFNIANDKWCFEVIGIWRSRWKERAGHQNFNRVFKCSLLTWRGI